MLAFIIRRVFQSAIVLLVVGLVAFAKFGPGRPPQDVALMLAGPALATDTTRWLNVHVTETHAGTNVEVHLPLSLVLSVLRSVDVEHFHSGKVDLEIHDADIDWPQLLSAIKLLEDDGYYG